EQIMKKANKRGSTRHANVRTAADGRVNLADLTRELRRYMRSRAPVDYERGKTRMQHAVQEILGRTEMRAGHIVAALVGRGYAHFARHPFVRRDRSQGIWELNPRP